MIGRLRVPDPPTGRTEWPTHKAKARRRRAARHRRARSRAVNRRAVRLKKGGRDTTKGAES